MRWDIATNTIVKLLLEPEKAEFSNFKIDITYQPQCNVINFVDKNCLKL